MDQVTDVSIAPTGRAATAFRYKAFISYSHRDSGWGRWLHRALETYRVPKHLAVASPPAAAVPPRIGAIFRDREELSSSADLGDRINGALAASESLVVICSPSAAQSRWVNEEILRFKQLGKGERIFAIIVAGEPNATAAGHPELECFPPALRHRYDALGNVTGPAEPIAADARKQGDGRRDALLKIVAALINVEFDDLKRRELVRRQRRFVLVTSASLAAAVVFALIAAYALIQRSEANAQRARAETEAATATQTTEFLVSLFRVSDPSESRGNTITAREILDAGATRIERELAGQPAVQARLMGTMGEVYTGLGLYDRADSLLRSALRRADAGTQRRAGSALQIQTALGRTLHYKGRYAEAEGVLRRALAERTAVGDGPAAERARAWTVLGEVLIELDRLHDAEAAFRRAIALAGRQGGRSISELIEATARLGVALVYQNRLETARPILRRALAMREARYGGDHPMVAVDLNELGHLEYAAGDLPAAEAYFRKALPLYRSIAGRRHPEVGSLLNNLGRVLLEQGKFLEARPLLVEALAVDRATRSSDHDQMVYSLNSLAMVELETRGPAAAAPLLSEALVLAQQGEPSMISDVLTNLADATCRRGDGNAGLRLAEEAQSAARTHNPGEAWRPALIDSIAAHCRLVMGQDALAEQQLLRAYPVLLSESGRRHLYTRRVLDRLIAFYEQRGDTVAARRFKRQR